MIESVHKQSNLEMELRKLSDQELIKEFLALGKQFSEMRIKLAQAKEAAEKEKKCKAIQKVVNILTLQCTWDVIS